MELAQNSLIILLRCCPFVYTRHTQADVHSSEAHLSWIIRVPFQINQCLPDSAPFGWNRGYTTVIPKLSISESPETFVKNVDSGVSLLRFWFFIPGEQFYIFNRYPLLSRYRSSVDCILRYANLSLLPIISFKVFHDGVELKRLIFCFLLLFKYN